MADAWINIQALAQKYGKSVQSVHYWIKRLPESDKKKIVVNKFKGGSSKVYVREKAADELFSQPKKLPKRKRTEWRKSNIRKRLVSLNVAEELYNELVQYGRQHDYDTFTQVINEILTDFLRNRNDR